jgi:5-methylcytosine-specific restriction endonuclease McrA
MGEIHELFESYGGEEAFIGALSDDEDEIIESEVRERNKIKHEIRRSRIKENGGKHTKEDIDEIRAAQGDKCSYCRIALHGKGHVDHISPVSRGGSDGKENLQLTCHSCNMMKGSSTSDELHMDIKCFALKRFVITEDIIAENEILKRIGVDGVRFALMNKWEWDYARAYIENAKGRAKLKRDLRKRRN